MFKFESLDFKIIKIQRILQNIRESSIISEQKSCHFISLDPGIIPPFKAGFPGSSPHDVSPVGFVSRPYGAQFLGAKSLWRFGVGMLQRAPNLPSGRCGSQGGNLWGIPQREVTWMRRFVFRFCEDDSIMPFPCFSWWEIFRFFPGLYWCARCYARDWIWIRMDEGYVGYQENIADLSFMVVSKKSRMCVS